MHSMQRCKGYTTLIATVSVIALTATACGKSEATTTQAPTTARIALTRYHSNTRSPWNVDAWDEYEMIVVDLDSNQERPLTDLVSSRNAVWSPDGIRIVFRSGGRIFLMGTDGSDLRQFTRTAGDFSDPSFHYGMSWSPDGTHIAF